MQGWSKRSPFFKFGILGIFFSFIVFFAGYATPVWYEIDLPDTKVGVVKYGLWQYCRGTLSDCLYLNVQENHVVRAFQTIASIIHLVSMISVIPIFCHKNTQMLIILTGILAGVVGLLGEIVFATWSTQFQYVTDNSHLSWSYALSIVGSILAIMSSIAVASDVRQTRRKAKDEEVPPVIRPEEYYVYGTDHRHILLFTTL